MSGNASPFKGPARHIGGGRWEDANGRPLPLEAPLAALGEGGTFVLDDGRTRTIVKVAVVLDRNGQPHTFVAHTGPTRKAWAEAQAKKAAP